MKEINIEVKSSIAYSVCSIIQKGISFFTLPIFTRLLSTTQQGQSTVYSSWFSVFTIFITLNLAYGSFQTAMVKFKDCRNEYESSICSLFFVLGLLFITLYLPLRQIANPLFELPTFIIIVMVCDIVATGISDCFLSKSRFEYRYKGVVFITLVKAFLGPLLAFLLIYLMQEKGYARIIGFSVTNIIVGFILLAIILRNGKVIYKREYWRYALCFNIPLIPYYVSQMIFNVSDRIMVSHFCGMDQAGIYGIAYSISLVLMFVINAINASYGPWFFQKLSSDRGEENQALSLKLAAIVALGLWAIISCAPEFIRIMGGEAYMSGVPAVPPVAASVLLLFYTQLFDRVLFYYEKKYYLVFSSIIPSILNLALNYVFIPRYGFVAAAYTTFVSYLMFALINYFLMIKTMKQMGNKSRLYNTYGLIGLLVGFCVLSCIMMILYDKVVIRYSIMSIVIVLVVVNYKKIVNLLRING